MYRDPVSNLVFVYTPTNYVVSHSKLPLLSFPLLKNNEYEKSKKTLHPIPQKKLNKKKKKIL